MNPLDLIKKHCKFSSEFDVYVLFRIARKKDNKNLTNSQEIVFREVIKEEDNIEKKYTKIRARCTNCRDTEDNKLNFYVYISVNSRDVRKGYITFKNDMLKYEREIMYGVACSNQLKRIDSIWLSAIMKPESRSKNRKFLLDVDTKDKKELDIIKKDIELFTKIILEQETKNGYHWVVDPYDKSRGKSFSVMEIKTDALLFIEHIQGGK